MTQSTHCLPDTRQLTAILAACARRHGVPGAQLAIHHRGRTTTVEFGECEHGSGRPVDAHTAFPVGSITKAFTATTVLTLVAEDDLGLDDPVGLHVPGLGGLGGDITVRHLLSHTAGLPCGAAAESVAEWSAQRYITQTCNPDNLVLPPGVGFSYSNVGYVLAGRIIESVTGMSWAEAVSAILLRPLGAATDLVGVPGAPASGRPVATGHSVNPAVGRTRPVEQSLTAAEAAAGALALTATDLVALGRLHVDDGVADVLSATYAAQMRTVAPQAVPFGLADGWGLGLAVFRDTGQDWFGHDGNADGTACYLRIEPTDGWVVALTTNANSGHGMWADVQADLARIGLHLPASRRPAAMPVTTPRPECAGTYANGDLEYLVRVDDDGGLRLSVDGDEPEEIVVLGDLTFYLRNAATRQWSIGGRFVRRHSQGLVEGIQVGGRIGVRRVAAHT